jgi:excisionase family DNA binding protein
MNKELERWLDMKEITAYLGVRHETVLQWILKNSMPAHKVGKLWKFKVSEVDEWVRSGGAATKG